MLTNYWRYRYFIAANAFRDLRYRYAGSSLGFFWNVLNPLFLIIIYTMVFSRLMNVRLPNMPHTAGFAIYLCSGLLPWIGFSETVMRCGNSLIENATYLKKLPIPEQIFVATSALSGLFGLIISIALLVVICCFWGHFPTETWLVLPVLLALFQLFGFGLGLIISVLNCFFRDVGQVMGLIIQLWFWGTPIVYTENILPDRLLGWLQLNPAYHFIKSLQGVIVESRLPSNSDWVVMVLISGLSILIGGLLLRTFRYEIRDVV